MHRNHHTGLPDRFIPCPFGARNTSDSCQKAKCVYVSIPIDAIYSNNVWIPSVWTTLLSIIFLLILIKYLLILCGVCCHIY